MDFRISEAASGENPRVSEQDGAQLPKMVVDARNSRCPMPILSTKRALKACITGQIVEVLVTDPDSARDIPRFVSESGLTLISSSEQAGEFRFCIRK